MPLQGSELRKDYIQDKYVIIAPRREQRPHDVKNPPLSKKQKETVCVFCPQKIDSAPALLTIKNSKNKWDIKVVANKFPAVTLDNPKAYGTQEVIIETPKHNFELEDLDVKHIKKILDVYAERTKAISKNPKIQYIIIFKNDGGVAGASLQHSHSQIFATDFLPPHIYDKSLKTHSYQIRTGRCVYCDVIEQERKNGRLIWEDKNVIVFTPYASMYNYEVWIMPKRHLDNITDLSHPERLSFATALKNILFSIGYLHLPYNYYFHQVINDSNQHLYLKVVPRGSVWAGVEIGSGVVINPISPEDAAEFYRHCFGGVCKL